jgi:hypothetical protein
MLVSANNRGEPSGSKELENTADAFYKLEEYRRPSENETILLLKEIKSRFSSPKRLFIKRVVESGSNFATHTIIPKEDWPSGIEQQNSQTVKSRIIAILDAIGGSEISYKELWKKVKKENISNNEGTFENTLLKLAGKHIEKKIAKHGKVGLLL